MDTMMNLKEEDIKLAREKVREDQAKLKAEEEAKKKMEEERKKKEKAMKKAAAKSK